MPYCISTVINSNSILHNAFVSIKNVFILLFEYWVHRKCDHFLSFCLSLSYTFQHINLSNWTVPVCVFFLLLFFSLNRLSAEGPSLISGLRLCELYPSNDVCKTSRLVLLKCSSNENALCHHISLDCLGFLMECEGMMVQKGPVEQLCPRSPISYVPIHRTCCLRVKWQEKMAHFCSEMLVWLLYGAYSFSLGSRGLDLSLATI